MDQDLPCLILIVEDERVQLETSASVDIAKTAAKACAHCWSQTLSCIFLDLRQQETFQNKLKVSSSHHQHSLDCSLRVQVEHANNTHIV